MAWEKDQKWESDWWGNCANTYWEETKQRVYASKMGLQAQSINGKYPVYDLQGRLILDIGGGPVSMLLKCINKRGVVTDPCTYPEWTIKRYNDDGILFYNYPGEKLVFDYSFDEVWIYNVLQHTMDPGEIIARARSASSIIRIFEWIDEPVSIGHPQLLTEEKLNKWLGGIGKTEHLNESGCTGHAYFGIFKGDNYAVSSLGTGTPTNE